MCEETEHLYAYNAYGAAVSEVEVDVLTGEVQILRVDILYDCGQRYNSSCLGVTSELRMSKIRTPRYIKAWVAEMVWLVWLWSYQT